MVSIPACVEECQQDKVFCILLPEGKKDKTYYPFNNTQGLSKINLPSSLFLNGRLDLFHTNVKVLILIKEKKQSTSH